MTKQWFNVDKNGLGKQAEELGKGRLVGELIQNAIDEDGVSKIVVYVEKISGVPQAWVTVEDDSPNGFADITHAYTLFATSKKRNNTEKRGQFNIGEKFVLSACYEASVETTTGTVRFDSDGRKNQPSKKRERGSVFKGRMRMTTKEYDEVLEYVSTLLLPDSVSLTVNDAEVTAPKPIHSFEATLQTPIADEEGVMRLRQRKTRVDVYESRNSETAMLYEMGLPVVETGDKWHLNIQQRVPISRDRTNVPPSYLKRLRTFVLDEMSNHLDEEDAANTWVTDAAENCSDESIERVLELRFGKKFASYDVSDPEANKLFVASGGNVVHGSQLPKGVWARAKDAGVIKPSREFTPSSKTTLYGRDGTPADSVPRMNWTSGMAQIVAYTEFLGRELLDRHLCVEIVTHRGPWFADYGQAQGQIRFNATQLGTRWFGRGITTDVDALIIHEFGQEYCGDHLDKRYYDALCDLGARLKQLAVQKPHELAKASAPVEEYDEPVLSGSASSPSSGVFPPVSGGQPWT